MYLIDAQTLVVGRGVSGAEDAAALADAIAGLPAFWEEGRNPTSPPQQPSKKDGESGEQLMGTK